MKYILLLLLSIYTLHAQNSTDLLSKPSIESKKEFAPEHILISEIPTASSKTLQELDQIEKSIKPSKEILNIHSSLDAYISSITNIINNELYNYLDDLDMNSLEKLSDELSTHEEQLNHSNKLLSTQIKKYNNQLKKLKFLSETWLKTRDKATKENTPKSLIQLVDSVISSINNLESSEKKQYDLLLIDSGKITKILLKIQEKKEKLKNIQEELEGQLFVRTSPWLFSNFDAQYFLPLKYFEMIAKNMKISFQNVVTFYNTHASRLLFLFILSVLTALFIGYFHKLYIKKTLFVQASSFHKKELFFLQRPISAFILLVILTNILIFDQRPDSLIKLTTFLIVIPIVRIFSSMIEHSLHKYLYSFFILFIFQLISTFSNGFDLTHQLFSLSLDILFSTIMFLFIRSIKKNTFRIISNKIILYALSINFLLFYLLSIITNLVGYTSLSYTLSTAVSTLITVSILLYLLSLILQGYILIIFRRRVTDISNKLIEFSAKMEQSIIFFIRLFMFSWWLFLFAKILHVDEDIILFKESLLAISWQVGELTLSIDSVVSFIIILVLTYFTARTLQIILTFFIFAKIRFGRGVATAISSVTNYIVIILGTLIALASLGISTQQFSLIFGALGVGIGFGLRNIIANFVSGIIMIFERPVQIGDTITVDDMMGDVTKIGSRSSTIKTYDGSEVIIPNADFISQKIINWTFSDKERRKTFYIKVAIGSDVQTVLDIMLDIAKKHPDVLSTPTPIATLLSVGEYYLEFKLYYWLTENVIVAPSDITIGIYNALLEAGIKMPAHKQEVLIEKEPS